MKKTILKLMVIFVAISTVPKLNAQVRPDIYSFDSTERAELGNLILDFVDTFIIKMHCDYTTIMKVGVNDYDIHDNFNFLPFHRTYLEKLEDYLLSRGKSKYVPLPKWTGLTVPPIEFSKVGPDSNGVDPQCGAMHCADVPSINCNSPIGWNDSVFLPRILQLPTDPNGNDLCDLNFQPYTYSNNNNNSNPSGLSNVIEGNTPPNTFGTTWHNQGHINLGGVMSNFRSPAAAIFWLWHAGVDDKWKEWECNCNKAVNAGGFDGRYDLYMKDNEFVVEYDRDRGQEPSFHWDVWASDDIWVRRQNDGFTNHVHENPEHYTTGPTNYVYVQVRNRGCIPSSGTNKLKLYWIKSTTGAIWPDNFDGSVIANNLPMGGLIDSINIPSVKAGGSTILEFEWNPPAPDDYPQVGDYLPRDFCLYARIESAVDTMAVAEDTNASLNTKNNNNIVWKNIIVLDDPSLIPPPGGGTTAGSATGRYYGSVYVANPFGDAEDFNLDFNAPEHLSEYAEIILTLPTDLYGLWSNSGASMTGSFDIIEENSEYYKLRIMSDNMVLKNIPMPANTQYPIAIEFDFLSDYLPQLAPIYRYTLEQRHASNNLLLGAEHFDIYTGNKEAIDADAGGNQEISVGETTVITAYDVGSTAEYNWYDAEGNLIYTGRSLEVSPEVTEEYKLEVISTIDGVKDYDEVEVEIRENEILSISPNPATNLANVNYKLGDVSSAYLMLQRPYSSIQNQYVLNTNSETIQINVSNLPTGSYTMTLVCDGVARHSKTIMIN